MIGKTISHYKIIEKIGEGGMGVIYKAEDQKLQRIVALKFLPRHLLSNSEDRDRFFQEAQAASALNHPNIMTIYSIEEDQGETFIAMEYIKGQTLKDKLQDGQLNQKGLINISLEVAKGLQSAHEQNIIHRDIKPENIMISTRGLVKIMDFGLAKRQGSSRVTKVGTTLGTLAYMSPEQAEGLEVDRVSDLFSFGIVLYEMASGKLPFNGKHEAAILYSVISEVQTPVRAVNPAIHPELERIINKALEKDPEDRYQHAEDLLADLKKLKKDLDSGRTTVTSLPAAAPEIEKKKPFWANPAFIWPVIIGILIIFAGLYLRFIPADDIFPSPVENSLAILYFENLKDPSDSERLGQILQELIIADLSEISSLKVFSSQRLFDIQKQLGSKERRKIDPELATEIAQRAGAQTMLTGNVIQAGEKLILTSQLIDANKGTILESQRVEGTDIYAMVDELAVDIQKDLQISPTADDRVDVAVKEKTTGSMTAYQYFLQGVDWLNDLKFDSAIVEFQKVITIDSTFSQAYYKMAIAQWWSQAQMGEASRQEALNSVAHVLSNRKNASTKERYMAQGAQALISGNWEEAKNIFKELVNFIPDEKESWYGLGEACFHSNNNIDQALEAFEQVLLLDPEFTLAYRHIFDIYHKQELYNQGIIKANQFVTLYPESQWGYYYLGTMFRGKRQIDKALELFHEAVKIDPDFVEAYRNIFTIYEEKKLFSDGIREARDIIASHPDHDWLNRFLANMYRGNGDLDRAITIQQESHLLNPTDLRLTADLGYTYQLSGRYDRAIESFGALTSQKNDPDWILKGNFLITSVLIEQGKIRQAQKQMRETLELARSISVDSEAGVYMNLAYLSLLLNDPNNTHSFINQARALNPNTSIMLVGQVLKGWTFYRYGQEKELEDLINLVREETGQEQVMNRHKFYYNALLVLQHLLREEYEQAVNEIENLQIFKELKDRFLYFLAIAYLNMEQYEPALAITNEMASPAIHSEVHTFAYPRAFYLRGLIYEARGNTELAIDSYESLLQIWRAADVDLIHHGDCIERLARLRQVG